MSIMPLCENLISVFAKLTLKYLKLCIMNVIFVEIYFIPFQLFCSVVISDDSKDEAVSLPMMT